MRGLTKFAAWAAVIVLAAFLLSHVGQGIYHRAADAALERIGALLDKKTGDIVVKQREIAANLRQAETRNTQSDREIRTELQRLQHQNAALKAELDRIGGEVSSVAVAVGEIAVGGSDTVVVGDGDFQHTYKDPWIRAMIERQGRNLLFDYETTFRMEEFDVEVTMPDGSKTHLFNTALVSDSTGDTLHVPVNRKVVERSPGASRFWWNPQLHLRGAGGLGEAWFGLGWSAFSRGRGTYIEGTVFWLLEGLVLVGGDGDVTVGASPLSWNVGRSLPVVKNLSVGPAWLWGEQQSGLGVIVGAGL